MLFKGITSWALPTKDEKWTLHKLMIYLPNNSIVYMVGVSIVHGFGAKNDWVLDCCMKLILSQFLHDKTIMKATEP